MFVEPHLVYLLVGFSFVAGLALGWGIFEICQVRRLIAEDQAERDIRIAKVEKPKLPRLPHVSRAERQWSRFDEDWLLQQDIDTDVRPAIRPRLPQE